MISRIYQAIPLQAGESIGLTASASHHLATVLRAKIKDKVCLFNGEGGEYSAVITDISKKIVTVKLLEHIAREAEAPVEIWLAQGISRGEKMDYIVQKAVELGAKGIVPLFTERSQVKLDSERSEKKRQHWLAVAIGACEQCGRNRLPQIASPMSLDRWLQTLTNTSEQRFVLAPNTCKKIKDYRMPESEQAILLIGPEGGLSTAEINLAITHGFEPLNLGPRVLRTETAAFAAIAALQSHWGDM